MTNRLAGILLITALLASCGGGSTDNQSTTDVGDDGPPGQLFGLDGVQYTSAAAPRDSNTVKFSPATGSTKLGGFFHFGYIVEHECVTKNDSNTGKTVTACYDDAPVSSPVTLSICGKDIATVTRLAGDTVLTVWELFQDQQSIDNFTAVSLMSNTNSGDPLSTGIKIGLPSTGCQTDWSWATADIQHDAASFKDAVTSARGNAPSWPTLQSVRDYEAASYRCARSGLYAAIRSNYAKVANVDNQLTGTVLAFVDLQGHISGAFDFSVTPPVPQLPDVMTFAADYNITPGGTAPFSFSASASDPIPNLQVSGQIRDTGMNLDYHTTDDSLASVGDGLLYPYSYLYTPTKYRFLARDLQYPARTGYPGATETLALTLDIGTDNSAEGNFFDFPSLLPWSVDVRPSGLVVRGTLNGNKLTLHYVDDEILGPPSNAGNFSLTFDATAKTLTGRFPTYDGKSFVNFGTDRPPLQGCGASPSQQT